MKGRLYLCATPIGNLEDITLRALRVLREVDFIAAEDTRVTIKLLNHYEIKKPMISYFEHNIRERGEEIVKRLLAGESAALVSDAGTPAISDPGEDLVRECIKAGIDVVPLPGAAAAVCALIISGFSTSRFVFEGFLPGKKGAREQRLRSLLNEERTMIFYEAPHKLKRTLGHMHAVFGNRNIVIARELTKLYEEALRMSIEEALEFYKEKEPRGEIVLLVEGAAERPAELENIDLSESVAAYEKEGVPLKEAMRLVARERGVSRREVYAKVLERKE